MSANMLDASFASDAPGARGMLALPLNLISLIVSHLDDVSDLARLCRTCRVLNYMALPQLYRDITLTSYDKIRYRDDFPEGLGSASPFSMGLNAVVTRGSVARLVRSFALRGEWREDGLEEYARVGRVPDSSMMLNITVRVAIERMVDLERFSWELNTKLLEPVYSGLAGLPKLTSLTVRFPSSRLPRPTIAIPPMPHLRALKVTHIDPLCYPDDLSTLFVHSRKLRDLKLHWSTRMREEQEPSVTLNHYFRKCIAMKVPMRLKKLAMMNFYALHSDDFEYAVDPDLMEEVTILSSPGVSETGVMSFVEASWPKPSRNHAKIKTMRIDRADKRGCEFLSDVASLEKLYMVHPVITAADLINSARPSSMASRSATMTPASGEMAANGFPPSVQSVAPPSFTSQALLADSYVQMLSTVHGERLRHLLLPSRWALPSSAIGRLIRGCPNLEQLGLATEISAFEIVALLLPFLRKLRALRLLIPTPLPTSNPTSSHGTPITNPPYCSAQNPYGHPHGSIPGYVDPSSQDCNTAKAIAEIVSLDDTIHSRALSVRLSDIELYGNLRIFGLGWKAWELGDFYTVPATEALRPLMHGVGAENLNSMDANGNGNAAGPMTRGGSRGTNPNANALPNGDARWSYASASAPSPPQASGVSVLGKRKDRGLDESEHGHNHSRPPLQQTQLSLSHPHLSLPVSASNNPSTPFPHPHPHPHSHSVPLHHPHHPHQKSQPPTQLQQQQQQQQQQPSQQPPEDHTSKPQPQPQSAPTLFPLPLLPHDISTLRTATGEPVSEHTKFEILRCMEHTGNTPAHTPTHTNANANGTGAASTGAVDGRIPDGMVLRRHVKRAGWNVLQEWEIWGLDAQEL